MENWIILGAIVAGGLWARQKNFFVAFWTLLTVMLAVYCALWSGQVLAMLMGRLTEAAAGYHLIFALLIGGAIAFMLFYKAGLEREEANWESYAFPRYFRKIAPIICGMLIGRMLIAFVLFLLCLLPARTALNHLCNFPEMEKYSTQVLASLSRTVDALSFQGDRERRKNLNEMLERHGEGDADLDAKLERARKERAARQSEEGAAAGTENTSAATPAK